VLWRVRVWGESTNEACGNFVNNDLPPGVFRHVDSQLGMSQACRNVSCVTQRIGRAASQSAEEAVIKKRVLPTLYEARTGNDEPRLKRVGGAYPEWASASRWRFRAAR
jgi:hypothetical protein